MASARDPNRHLSVAHLKDNLLGLSLRGGAVTAIAQFVKLAAQIVAVALLARLLPPTAFGLIAMVAALFALLELFKDLGLTAATIQRPEISHREVSTLFWINVAVGVVIFGALYFLAPLVARFYGQPGLTDIARVLGAGFLISGCTAQHIAILRRQMRFGTVASAEVGAELLGLAVAVGAALEGAGYWALVAQRLTAIAAMCVAAWALSPWRPGRPAFAAGTGALIGFGGNFTAFNVVNLLARSLDQVLIGWYWGAVTLGLYERAYKLLTAPINNINAPLYAVVLPTLSRLTDEPDRYRRTYLKTLEKLSMVTMPGAALVIATADWVVALVFGPGWHDAAPILAFLGVAALFQPAANTTGWLFLSQNRTAEMLRWGLIGSLLTVIAVVAGLPFGAVGVAASYAISGLCLRLPILFWSVGRRGPVATRELYRAVLPSALAAVVVFAAVGGLRRLPALHQVDPALGLAGAAAAAGVLALACFLIVPASRRALGEFRRLPALMLSQGARA
jgi:PST family polysaccharide transporter